MFSSMLESRVSRSRLPCACRRSAGCLSVQAPAGKTGEKNVGPGFTGWPERGHGEREGVV